MMRGDASGIPTEGDTVEGYEHLHPDIAAMLLADGSGSNTHFAVDAPTLTLVRRDGPAIATTDTLQMDQLAGLADECDRAAFSVQIERGIPKKIAGLIHLSRFPSSEIYEDSGSSPAVLVASTVAINLLESSIRDATAGNRVANNNSNKSKGNASQKGAPLLRDMIEEISCMRRPPSANDSGGNIAAADLAPILRALLLPTKVGGINLRNLATHGFLSRIDSRWLSLTLVLMQTLDKLQDSNAEETAAVATDNGGDKNSVDISSSLRKYAPMESEVLHGRTFLLDDSKLKNLERELQVLVPSTHIPLLRFSLQCLAPTLRSDDERTEGGNLIPALTVVFATALCCLIEHSLRILWCEHNNRPDDRIARPASYYVTLDGHGQRDRHDVMLALYLSDERTKNQLIPVIGAQPCALLSDLFAASANDAPNIRSALCHGSWNGELIRELEGLASFERIDARPERSNPLLVDSACALVSCMDMLSASLAGKSRSWQYRPVYSYTATAARSLSDVLRGLSKLEALISNNTFIRNCTQTMESEHSKLCGALKPFRVETEAIEELVCSIFPSFVSDEVFNIDSIYREHETNLVLADNVVALALLSDASHATKNYLAGLQERIDSLPTEPKNTKERRMVKSASRYFSAATVVWDFYAWSVVVALVAVRHSVLPQEVIEEGCNREDIVRASERTRMTLSTFYAYLAVNLDRSLKALQQYLNGKAVKRVLLHVNETKH